MGIPGARATVYLRNREDLDRVLKNILLSGCSKTFRCKASFDWLTLRPAQGDKTVVMVSAACPELAEGNHAAQPFGKLRVNSADAVPALRVTQDKLRGDGRFVKPSAFSGKEDCYPNALPCGTRPRSTAC